MHWNRYTPTCLRLLGQYKTLLKSPGVSSAFGDLESFKREYDVPSPSPHTPSYTPTDKPTPQIEYPSATERLKIGVPATFEQPVHNSASSAPTAISAKAAAEATQNFITFMDALRLSYTAKDQLHPLLSDVITAVNNVTGAKEFEGRQNIIKWLIVLNQMGAGDEITEAQGRQVSFSPYCTEGCEG